MVGFGLYDLRARIYPGLLAIPPITVLVITLGLKKYPTVAAVGGVILGALGAYLLAILVRYFGKTPEARLWASWGGRDTTRLLRLRDTSANPVERDIWRAALENLTGIHLLDAPAETADPVLADQTIEAAIGQVLPLGRGDKRYPIVFAENIHYGFQRNLWGIRWIGRGIAFASVLALAGVLIAGPVKIGGTTVSTGAIVAGIVVDGLLCLGWLVIPSKARVKFASDRYARQLLEAVVTESRTTTGNTPPGKRQSRRPRA